MLAGCASLLPLSSSPRFCCGSGRRFYGSSEPPNGFEEFHEMSAAHGKGYSSHSGSILRRASRPRRSRPISSFARPPQRCRSFSSLTSRSQHRRSESCQAETASPRLSTCTSTGLTTSSSIAAGCTTGPPRSIYRASRQRGFAVVTGPIAIAEVNSTSRNVEIRKSTTSNKRWPSLTDGRAEAASVRVVIPAPSVQHCPRAPEVEVPLTFHIRRCRRSIARLTDPPHAAWLGGRGENQLDVDLADGRRFKGCAHGAERGGGMKRLQRAALLTELVEQMHDHDSWNREQ